MTENRQRRKKQPQTCAESDCVATLVASLVLKFVCVWVFRAQRELKLGDVGRSFLEKFNFFNLLFQKDAKKRR